MMTSKPVNTKPENNAETLASSEELIPDSEELLSKEENPHNIESEKENNDKTTRIELPEPDAENITVLTHKLPNKPILPWNHYDSPWEESEVEQSAEQQEISTDLVASELNPEETTINPPQDRLELDKNNT